MAIEWSIVTYENLASTQDFLKKQIVNSKSNFYEGSVVHAFNQTKGYGRHGRMWKGGQGNLFLSFLISPKCNVNKVGQISLLTGLAISRAIDNIICPEAPASLLKWPNDILIQNKKCCGILIDASPMEENRINYLIIGVGVNIRSNPLHTATFLEKYTNSHIKIEEFMQEILFYFKSYYEMWVDSGFEKLRDEWLSKTYDVGSKIGVKIGDRHIEGRFVTIDILGNLVLMCSESGEKKKITSGDVFLL